jgi:hypothetical protein
MDKPSPTRAGRNAGQTQTRRPRTVPSHQDFLTIIVCGRDLGSDPRLNFFEKVVFHDEVANQLEAYPLVQGRLITG